jgi:cell division protein FtsW (lipid II flippase)
MINMAVAVNLFPVTGQPLPLVSMGGTIHVVYQPGYRNYPERQS